MNVDNLIGVKLGNFRLERLLGRGTMGVVYLARDEALLRPTAVKILSWSLPEQHGLNPEASFLAEARNVARINHPHVIGIYGVAKQDPHCYIAMEYVDGSAADDWVTAHGPFSPLRATEILLQSASALQAAHDAEVVHRDVKPDNLLITADGTAKLGDFGMAMSTNREAAPGPVRAGTPYYTAPEVWRGHLASPASDIYALGATYFYLLTGRPPFEASTIQDLTAAHLQANVPLISNVPRVCNEVIQRCMAKSPEDRYLSAQVLSWEVRGVVRELNGLTSAATAGGSVNPHSATSVGEPFRSVREALRATLDDPAFHSVLLSGERGSGKTTLVQQLMAVRQGSSPVAFLSKDEPGKSLQQQVARAFGIVPALGSKANAEIDGLLEQLERAHPGYTSPAWLVLDNVTPSAARLAELAVLMQAASKSRAFRILLIAPPELEERLWRDTLRGEDVAMRRIVMLPLTARQTLDYMTDWLRSGLVPDSRRVLITPDAALLIAHRSGGNLQRINRLATTMLAAASREQRAVLCSWDAWSACDDDRGVAPAGPEPRDWPTPEVLEILNALRRVAGIATRQ